MNKSSVIDYTFDALTTDELRDLIVDYLGKKPADQDDNEWCVAAIREFRRRTEPEDKHD